MNYFEIRDLAIQCKNCAADLQGMLDKLMREIEQAEHRLQRVEKLYKLLNESGFK